jgi:predicted lipoprotein with Yx(FWY)xxD motif
VKGRLGRLLLLATVFTALTGCGKTASPTSYTTVPPAQESPGHPTIDVERFVQVRSTVLVDAKGYPLYLYEPDRRRAVTCAGVCAQSWPPVFDASGARITTGPGVRANLVGTDADPTGGRVVTYRGWPLYTYAGDPQAGFSAGEGLDIDGGYWYLLRPDGQPVLPPA